MTEEKLRQKLLVLLDNFPYPNPRIGSNRWLFIDQILALFHDEELKPPEYHCPYCKRNFKVIGPG